MVDRVTCPACLALLGGASGVPADAALRARDASADAAAELDSLRLHNASVVAALESEHRGFEAAVALDGTHRLALADALGHDAGNSWEDLLGAVRRYVGAASPVHGILALFDCGAPVYQTNRAADLDRVTCPACLRAMARAAAQKAERDYDGHLATLRAEMGVGPEVDLVDAVRRYARLKAPEPEGRVRLDLALSDSDEGDDIGAIVDGVIGRLPAGSTARVLVIEVAKEEG